jgi:hypothetical protein
MPCDGTHLRRTNVEKASVAVRALLVEVGLLRKRDKGDAYYGDPDNLDTDTARLCEWCQAHPPQVKAGSLELQIWWRDHLRADAKKAAAAAKAAVRP